MGEQYIRCFQHCKPANIFCLAVPDVCPLCGKNLEGTESRIPPFRVPSPFAESTDSPFCIVIKPTNGSFIGTYKHSDDIHIGLTNSAGVVYDFDEDGVHIGASQWIDCLAVPLHKLPTSAWDRGLHQFALSWKRGYSERDCNCYTFVLDCLKELRMDRHHPCINNRLQFCESMVLPVSTKAAKYITLYRKVNSAGLLVQEVT